ncbi:MAG: carbohydrate binding family 9 domain-containing protein, partial [Candidatus Halalkalibacterium sp. M3_1C_030]
MKLNTVLKLFLSVFFLIMYFPETIHAQNENETEVPSKFEALYIQNDFDISADLKNSAWEKAPSVYIKNQVQPNDAAAAKVQTEVKVLYSKKNLYIGFIANEPNPEDIRANITDRDNAFQDDFVGVFIDPFNNNQQAFELFVNPLGIQMDGMRSGNSEDMNFDLLWYSDGKVTDSGYRAVMKIPFKSLNFPKKQVHNWSIQFLRNYPRNSRYQFTWTDVELSNPCLICQNGMMTGIKDIENTKTVELLPYAMSFQESTIRNAADPQSGLNHGTIDGRFGGSVFYAPSSMTSINAVINPDFSQVETDAAQISANETFALFFP